MLALKATTLFWNRHASRVKQPPLGHIMPGGKSIFTTQRPRSVEMMQLLGAKAHSGC